MTDSHIQYSDTLSLKQQFRLVEIAHETTDSTIRKLALQVLQQYLVPNYLIPPMTMQPSGTPTREEYDVLSQIGR